MEMLHRLHVGDTVLVKVGKNAIKAEILEVRPDHVRLKSQGTGREFRATRILELVRRIEDSIPTKPTMTAISATVPQSEPSAIPETMPSSHSVTDNAETGGTAVPTRRKSSLINAALEVLRKSGIPLNTREMVKQAIEAGLWEPSAGKTPEQTLYSAIFLEIKKMEHPRFKRSDARGKFELA